MTADGCASRLRPRHYVVASPLRYGFTNYQLFAQEECATTPPFLPNEASWKMRRYGRKRRDVNLLRRLQKNDNWLRFPGKWVESMDQNTPHPNPLPYTTTASRPTRLPPRGEGKSYLADTSWKWVDGRRTDMDLHGRYTDAGAMAWGIFELMRESGFSNGYPCDERPFNKLRVTDGGRGECEGERQTLPLWGARSGVMMWALWLREKLWSRERCFDKLSMTDRGGRRRWMALALWRGGFLN